MPKCLLPILSKGEINLPSKKDQIAAINNRALKNKVLGIFLLHQRLIVIKSGLKVSGVTHKSGYLLGRRMY